jgi:hypothetical protein
MSVQKAPDLKHLAARTGGFGIKAAIATPRVTNLGEPMKKILTVWMMLASATTYAAAADGDVKESPCVQAYEQVSDIYMSKSLELEKSRVGLGAGAVVTGVLVGVVCTKTGAGLGACAIAGSTVAGAIGFQFANRTFELTDLENASFVLDVYQGDDQDSADKFGFDTQLNASTAQALVKKLMDSGALCEDGQPMKYEKVMGAVLNASQEKQARN